MEESKTIKYLNYPQIEIVQQPSEDTRFRYECEKKTSYVLGVNSFPAIRMINYNGPVTVIITCVTKDPPYKPHPFKVSNGINKYKHGVSYIYKHCSNKKIRFKNLVITRVGRKYLAESLTERERMQADPFNTGFEHKFLPEAIELYCVRLCFQVVLESPFYQSISVDPVVSEPIYDTQQPRRSIPNIYWLSHDSASVAGGSQISILSNKVVKSDIEVLFYHKESNWEARGKFVGPGVFKQKSIVIETPAYKTDTISPENLKEPLEVSVYLMRPSDGEMSDPKPFQLLPLETGLDRFKATLGTADGFPLKRKEEQRKRKQWKREQYPKESSVDMCNALQAKIVKYEGCSQLNNVPYEIWELPPVVISSMKTTESCNSIPNISAVRLQSSSMEHSPAGSQKNVLSVKPIEHDVPMDTTYHFDIESVPSEFIIEVPERSEACNLTDNFAEVNSMEEVLDVINKDLNSQQILSNSTGTSGVPYEPRTNFVTLSLPSVEVDNMIDPISITKSSVQLLDNFVHSEVIQESTDDLDDLILSHMLSDVNLNFENYYSDNATENEAEGRERKLEKS